MSPTVITLDRIARALGTELVIDFEPTDDDDGSRHTVVVDARLTRRRR